MIHLVVIFNSITQLIGQPIKLFSYLCFSRVSRSNQLEALRLWLENVCMVHATDGETESSGLDGQRELQ